MYRVLVKRTKALAWPDVALEETSEQESAILALRDQKFPVLSEKAKVGNKGTFPVGISGTDVYAEGCFYGKGVMSVEPVHEIADLRGNEHVSAKCVLEHGEFPHLWNKALGCSSVDEVVQDALEEEQISRQGEVLVAFEDIHI